MDNIKAALYGVAIGDALGATIEGLTKIEILEEYGILTNIIGGGWLNLKPGEVTDDTQMTLAVARGIVTNPRNPRNQIAKELVKWYRSGPKDIGVTCQIAIEQYLKTGKWQDELHQKYQEQHSGNGALMRCIYPALYYRKLKDALRVAQSQGLMTHYSIKSAQAIQVYTTMIHTAIEQPRRELSMFVATYIACDSALLGGIPEMKEKDLKPTGYVVDSLRTAAWYVFMRDFDFEQAVIRAVNAGGDADTIGAIAGGLAGAIWGMEAIPERWIEALDPEVRGEIDSLAERAAINRYGKRRWFKMDGRRIAYGEHR